MATKKQPIMVQVDGVVREATADELEMIAVVRQSNPPEPTEIVE
jgi:hypothetical protein